MSRSAFLPPELLAEDDDWVLVLARTLRQPPPLVWAALTEPEQIIHWLPYVPDRRLDAVGPVRLTDVGMPDPETRTGFVHEVTAAELLVLSWDTDVLRWELRAGDGGSLLTLRHRFTDRPQAPSYAAGWHLCLDALANRLDGGPVEAVVGQDAMAHGYQPLLEGYAKALNIPLPAPHPD